MKQPKKLYIAHMGYRIADHVLYIAAPSPKAALAIYAKHSSGKTLFSLEERGTLLE